MNVNQPQGQPAIKPASKPEGGVKPAETSPEPGLHPKLCDQSQTRDPFLDRIAKLPPAGPTGLKPNPSFHDVGRDVERILSIGVAHANARERGTGAIKTPDVEFQLAIVMDNMTPGEMDELRDTIVERMAGQDTSQRERDVLKRMYHFVDSQADEATGIKPGLRKIIDELRGQLQWNGEDVRMLEKHPQDIEAFSAKLKKLE